MDFALGVDAEVEAVQLLQHIKAAEPGVPQRHGFDVQPFVRLQLAAQVLAAALGERDRYSSVLEKSMGT